MFFYIFPITTSISLSWITPIFVSGYLIDKSFIYVFLQIFQLFLACLIYFPFIKNYEKHLKKNEYFDNLKNSLGIEEHIEKKMHVNSIKKQQSILSKERKISALVKELTRGELLLYYQPKIDIKNSKVKGYEALLRFKKPDGIIVGPYFIDKIIEVGFDRLIDTWVINQLKKDLLKWKEDNYYPQISINISPESISNKNIIKKIIKELQGYMVNIEILEKTFAKNTNQLINNIKKLRENGFTISIDDFGSGFSSLQYLNILPVDYIKFDRNLILNTTTESGEILYKNVALLCRNQGYTVIAEGIETNRELAIAVDSKIDLIQGFYFSKAITSSELKLYEEEFSNRKLNIN